MDHDAAVRQGVALALGAGGQEERAHAGALADAVGGDVAGDPLHRVVDRQAGGDAAAGAVDVEVDVALASWCARTSIWATMRLATVSSMAVPRMMMRSWSRRE